MKKGTKLYSILKNKCPHCHEGNFFTSNVFSLKNIGNIFDLCPICKETYYPETGFYFGAMYVSYALGTSYFVTIWFGLSILGIELEILTKIIVLSILWILLSPIIHRLSKIIWANMFISFASKRNR